jgi:integrase
MATIEKRASGRYRVMIRRRGQRLDRTFDSRRAARDWAVEVEGKILTGALVDLGEARRTTLGEALERYRDEVTHTKRGAAQERIRIGQWLADPLAARTLVSVRSTDIAAWRSRMVERGYAPTTIRNALTIISQVYRTAASEWGMSELRNPVQGVRLPKHRPGRDRRLEPGEEEALLSTARYLGCPWLLSAIVVSLETAMRRGELLSLRWNDVLPDRVLIRTTKNGRPRVVALSSRAREALAEMPRSLDGRVFPLTAPALDHRWREARRLASVSGLHWHDLRHEAVSRLFEKGLTTEEVMSMSGHRTYVTVRCGCSVRVLGGLLR